MTIRRDHIAGLALALLAVAVIVLGHDLPFGTAASPGPGMLPTLCAALLFALAIIVLARAHTGPAFAEIEWDDVPHALRVILAAAAATALYTTLGFPLTFGLLLLGLMVGVERMPILPALAITAVMTIGGYLVLGRLLKTPVPQGIFGF